MKLLEIFRTLERSDLNGFGRYVESAVKDEKIYALFLFFKKRYPHFQFDVKNKPKLFKKIYGDKKYSAKKLNYLISDLTIILEDFVVLIHTRKHKMQKQFFLLDYYKHQSQDKLFERTANEILSDITSRQIKDGEYYLDKMRVFYDLYFHIPSDKKRVEIQVSRANDIIESIDEFYAYYKLKVESDFKVLSNYKVKQNEQFLLTELINSINKLPLKENPLIDIYLYAIEHFEKASEEYYEVFKEKITKILPELPSIHQKDLMSYIYNYVIQGSTKGFPNYHKYMFELFQLGLDKGYSISNDKIDHQLLINAVIIAVAVNELEWGKKIINEHKDKLKDDIRDDCVQLSLANIAYAEKDYQEVLYQLNTIQGFRHYTFGMQGRVLLLKCYYELEREGDRQGELIYNFADSFKNYVKRNKVVTGKFQTAMVSFIKFTMKILNNSFTKKIPPEALREELNAYKHPVFAKRWLNLKIDELLKKGRY